MPPHFSWKRMSLILILGKQSQFMGKIQNKKMIFINLCFWRPSCRLSKSSSSSSNEFFCQFRATILLLRKKIEMNTFL